VLSDGVSTTKTFPKPKLSQMNRKRHPQLHLINRNRSHSFEISREKLRKTFLHFLMFFIKYCKMLVFLRRKSTDLSDDPILS